MKKLMLIGDVHGYVERYNDLLNNAFVEGINDSIQLGDFGFQKQHDWFIENIHVGNHKILFGNHDYYPYLDKPYSLGNFGYLEEYDLFYIRGAWSIDYKHRILGRDLFENEELNVKESNECIKLYEKVKPGRVISHDCPLMIYPQVLTNTGKIANRPTPRLLNELFKIHEPKEWYFGHHHNSIIIYIKDTKFQCLDELETYILEF